MAADTVADQTEAARLEELRLAAVEARIDADLALGRHDALTAELEQLVAAHPLREQLLNELGYRASLHAVPIDRFFADLGHPRTKIQMNFGPGWGPDFSRPSTFFSPLLSCQSAGQPGTNNWAEFCDPRIDTLASQAQAAQLTDPAAARQLWAKTDRIVTDQAPIVPVLNIGLAGFVSSRAGNYQASPVYGPLLDQMWVR